MAKTSVGKSYEASSIEEQRATYDEWAQSYEAELCAMGYRIPAVIATVFTRFVPPDTAPILDAGCGGGIQAEPIAMLGYGPIFGIDLSEGMLEVARGKSIYADLKQAALGEVLDFPDDHFAAVISAGTITPKHAPADSFDELVRVSSPGAPIIFSLRDDPDQEPEYPRALQRLVEQGRWKRVFETASFHSMPYGEPDITHRVHVYEVL